MGAGGTAGLLLLLLLLAALSFSPLPATWEVEHLTTPSLLGLLASLLTSTVLHYDRLGGPTTSSTGMATAMVVASGATTFLFTLKWGLNSEGLNIY